MSRHLLQFSNLFHSFGFTPLFEGIALSINEGELFALIGENGAGKTTLLQLLARQRTADAGELSQGPHVTVGFLPQEIVIPHSTLLVRQFIEGELLADLERTMNGCLEDPARLDEWAELHEEYQRLGGYRRIPIEQVLRGLKLDRGLLDRPMSELSSGQRMRVGLAKVLIDNPTLLLLDEPTNHLDQEMLDWLQAFLKQRKGSCVIVSHDRKFLNEVCNRLVELKEGKLTVYGGNYDFYLAEQERRLERQLKAYELQQEERIYLMKQIKSITFSKRKASPPKDRNLMAYDKRGEKHQKSLQHRLDVMKARLEAIEANVLPHPKPKNTPGLLFSTTPLASLVALELEHATKSYGDHVLFADVCKSFCAGDRIVITGPNGCGKTTLLKAMAGLIDLDEGKVRYAPTCKISFLDQDVTRLPMNQTPLEYFERVFQLSEEDVRRELQKAGLSGEDLLHLPFTSLSTGQRKRMMLLALSLEKPNVLLLDEPTNHLDFKTLEALEKALLTFEGVIVSVSHDAAYIEKLATQEWKFS